jgi:DNA mismatch repair protein MSH2
MLQSASVEQHRDVLERPAAAYALAGLLSHSALMSDPAGHGRHTLALHDPGRFMRLDAAALRALNVLPQRGDGPGGFSLYSLMCRARTPMGKRLLRVCGSGRCYDCLSNTFFPCCITTPSSRC